MIASYLLQSAGELALVEIGPTSTLDKLLAGLSATGVDPADIDKLLVTHIHLDHAGAAGTFMAHFPRARLYVHEIGASHLIAPEKLIRSATRIYGDMMGPLWGEVVPVPADRVVVLADGDVITVGNYRLDVIYTPGHAIHHVVFHEAQRGDLFTGDVAAVRLQGMRYVRPPTPPPDVDLPAWHDSIERLRALRPAALYLTHFGPFTDIDRHLDEADRQLVAWGEIVRKAAESGQHSREIADNLRLHGNRELLAETNDAQRIEDYELAAPYGMTVDGYLRYFRQHAAASS